MGGLFQDFTWDEYFDFFFQTTGVSNVSNFSGLGATKKKQKHFDVHFRLFLVMFSIVLASC